MAGDINPQTAQYRQDLEDTLDALLTDITMLKTWGATLATKLNADAGVTDTNYASPGALTTTT